MIEILTNWIRTLAASALLGSAALSMTPKGMAKGAVRLVCALMLTAALAAPLRELDPDTLAEGLARQRLLERELTDQTTSDMALLQQIVIQKESEAYIWDKASLLGIHDIRVKVTLRTGEDVPYPWSIEIGGRIAPAQREELSRLLLADLGVPEERQIWYTDDED